MRKSGLHKQISSIFDGVPVPHSGVAQEGAEVPSVLMQPQAQDTIKSETKQETAAAPQTPAASGPSTVNRLTADPSECASTPAIQVCRPMPLPRSAMTASKSGLGFYSQIKKTISGAGKTSLDARQKKMASLVGILSIVFGVVMFVSLGGVGKSKAVAAENPAETTNLIGSAKKNVEDWTLPAPLPEDLRDATSPSSRRAGPQGDGQIETGTSELIVKGIVFSKDKPSAVINNMILKEGQSINGCTIVKITKESVEFEANEKRWTQHVQR